MASAKQYEWKEICKAASKELDSENLMALIEDLIRALDSQKMPQHRRTPQA